MKTRYIYTYEAEKIARSNNLPEYRKAGTAAHFGYQPLEEAPQIAQAWLEAGIIAEAPEPVNFLTFTFADYTQATYMRKLFNENGIKWNYGAYQEMYADINKDGQPVKVDCYHIARDPETGLNLFGIMEKPKRTTEYFNMSPEDLSKENADGYTKEEALLCDHNIHAMPFCPTYENAAAKAESYKKLGCEEVEILQRINNKYAVVSY